MCTKTQGLEDSQVSWHKMHFHQIARKASIVSENQSRAPSIPLPITSNPRFKPVPTNINTQSCSWQLSRARRRRISLQTPPLAEQHLQTQATIAPCIIISPANMGTGEECHCFSRVLRNMGNRGETFGVMRCHRAGTGSPRLTTLDGIVVVTTSNIIFP